MIQAILSTLRRFFGLTPMKHFLIKDGDGNEVGEIDLPDDVAEPLSIELDPEESNLGGGPGNE